MPPAAVATAPTRPRPAGMPATGPRGGAATTSAEGPGPRGPGAVRPPAFPRCETTGTTSGRPGGRHHRGGTLRARSSAAPTAAPATGHTTAASPHPASAAAASHPAWSGRSSQTSSASKKAGWRPVAPSLGSNLGDWRHIRPRVVIMQRHFHKRRAPDGGSKSKTGPPAIPRRDGRGPRASANWRNTISRGESGQEARLEVVGDFLAHSVVVLGPAPRSS